MAKTKSPLYGHWYMVELRKNIHKAHRDFSISKQREMKSVRIQVIGNINFERDQPQPDRENIESLVSKLKEINIEKQKKIFISTNNEVIEPGERPSKYFLNQLKSKQTKQSMSSLQNGNGKLLTDQRDLLKETVNYYTNLYTAKDNLNKKEQTIFLNNIHRKLPEKDKQDLETDLTEKEALWQAENEKTSGCDGIPYEFYKKIWPIIGKDLFEAMNFNLNENKALSVSQHTSIITLRNNKGNKVIIKKI